MRKSAITCALVLLVTRLGLAQEWTEYRRVQDGFEALFPGQPRVTETTWKRLCQRGLRSRCCSSQASAGSIRTGRTFATGRYTHMRFMV